MKKFSQAGEGSDSGCLTTAASVKLTRLAQATMLGVACAIVAAAPKCEAANTMGFDLNGMNYTSVQPPAEKALLSQFMPQLPIELPFELPLPVPPNQNRNSGFTSNQGFFLPDARATLMAPQSVDMAPVPSASFKYGFAEVGAAPYLGVCSSKSIAPSFGGVLPPCATSSVDINIVDGPMRSSGGNSIGGGGSGGGGGTGSSGQQGMPSLPPGWIGVQNSHSGAYMGAIPPGGTLEAFFRGEYGIEPGQEAEAAWILQNQLPRLGGGW